MDKWKPLPLGVRRLHQTFRPVFESHHHVIQYLLDAPNPVIVQREVALPVRPGGLRLPRQTSCSKPSCLELSANL